MDLPDPYVGDWAPQLDAPPPGLNPDASVMRLREDDLHRCRAGYYGLINHVDDQISRLLKGYRESGLLDDTLVLFTSDHGEMLGDHNLFRKTWPYEGSIRVPFLARAPEWMDCTAGLSVDRPVGLQDVMPTILDAGGVPIPESVDGASVLPFMRGDSPAWRGLPARRALRLLRARPGQSVGHGRPRKADLVHPDRRRTVLRSPRRPTGDAQRRE